MYFLNKEERMYLNKGLVPESRENYYDNDLRGWNWQRPPLKPVYDMKLAVHEISNNYCPTSRDLYLKKVINIKQKLNKYMIRGIVLHNTIMKFITYCKKEIYNMSIENIDNFNIDLSEEILNNILNSNNFNLENENKLREEINTLWKFEKQRVIYRIQEVLSRQPYIGVDALLYQSIPVVVEHKLNGSFLGLSPHLSTDAINFSEAIIVDIKFGKPRNFHKLSVTGYALVMEAIHSFPVNIGCLVYPSFKSGRILLDREFFIINDELRQKFIESRDDKMRFIYEEDDPGVSDKCYKTCPFYNDCH